MASPGGFVMPLRSQNLRLMRSNMWYSCQGWQGLERWHRERSLNWRRRRSVDRWEICVIWNVITYHGVICFVYDFGGRLGWTPLVVNLSYHTYPCSAVHTNIPAPYRPPRASYGLLQVDTVESMSKQCYKIQKYGIYPTRSFQRSKLEKQVAKGGTAKRTQSIDATIAILFTLLLSCTKATMGYIILCINLIQQFLGITCQ